MSDCILITGAGSGLGRELAIAYARRGHAVACADINVDNANATVAMLAGSGHRAYPIDVADIEAWRALRAQLRLDYDHVAALVNNAGIASGGEMHHVSPAEWDRVIAVNLSSVHWGVLTFAADMVERRKGQILNVASFAGFAGAPLLGVYGVSKAGVIALSESLRADLHHSGVTVHVLCPSFFQTNLMQSASAGMDPRVTKFATKAMEKGALSAADVATYTLERMDRGEFLILPHPASRQAWRVKRWFPNFYFRKLVGLKR